MANETGTAQNFEDLFGKMVSFLTTNKTLKDSGQAWQVLRLRRDNLAGVTSDLNGSADVRYRKIVHTCRYDPRSLNTDSITSNYHSNFSASNALMGKSFVRFHLRDAREVKVVSLRAPSYTSDLNAMVRNFRLQCSDDDAVWTTVMSVTSAPVFSVGEARQYAVEGTPGKHLYWRIVIDSVQSGTTYAAWARMLLLEGDGTVANHFGSEVILKGLGNAGTDEIFVGIRSEYDLESGWYNLFLNGYTGFDPNEQSWLEQPGALPGNKAYSLSTPMVPCWDAPMPYWFAASGRSFRFGVKVSTSYEGGYLGFILPYATPGQYPYPLAVGGSLVPQDARSAEWRYSYVNVRHGVYPAPGIGGDGSKEGQPAALYMRGPDGSWLYFGNRGQSGAAPDYIYGVQSGAWRTVWPHCMNDSWSTGKLPYRECLGGGYVLQPCILLQRGPSYAVFGELEGTYVISGYQNAAENIATLNGKKHVVLQNAYRNTVHEFWALSLD